MLGPALNLGANKGGFKLNSWNIYHCCRIALDFNSVGVSKYVGNNNSTDVGYLFVCYEYLLLSLGYE